MWDRCDQVPRHQISVETRSNKIVKTIPGGGTQHKHRPRTRWAYTACAEVFGHHVQDVRAMSTAQQPFGANTMHDHHRADSARVQQQLISLIKTLTVSQGTLSGTTSDPPTWVIPGGTPGLCCVYHGSNV